jgi:hypothetical protein
MIKIKKYTSIRAIRCGSGADVVRRKMSPTTVTSRHSIHRVYGPTPENLGSMSLMNLQPTKPSELCAVADLPPLSTEWREHLVVPLIVVCETIGSWWWSHRSSNLYLSHYDNMQR